MTDLGTLPGAGTGNSYGYSINDGGQIVGSSSSADGSHAFLYSGGTMTDLGTLPGDAESTAFGINNSGQVVGSSYGGSDENDFHAFLCCINAGSVTIADVLTTIKEALGTAPPPPNSGSIMVVNIQTYIDEVIAANTPQPQSSARPQSHPLTAARIREGVVGLAYSLIDLGTLGGSPTTAHGINNLGQVVGESATGRLSDGPIRHAFLWEAGYMTDLGPPAGVAYAINDAGEVAGVHRYPDRHTESFRYTSGTAMASIPEGRVSAINNTGQVVGGIPSGSAFLWNAGTLTYLGTLGGTGSQAYAINDLGQIAGSAYMSGNSAMHSFLWNGAGLMDLGTLGGTNSVAFGINNAGQIVGSSQTAPFHRKECMAELPLM